MELIHLIFEMLEYLAVVHFVAGEAATLPYVGNEDNSMSTLDLKNNKIKTMQVAS